jgi:uncharacterized protein (TIGR02246 family)
MRSIARVAAVLLVPVTLVAQPKPKATSVANTKMTALEQSVSATLHDAWDAYAKQDAARFAPFVAEDGMQISYMGIGSMKRADVAQMVKSCTTRKWATSDLKVKEVTPDVVIATYKATVDQTCDGKVQPPEYYVSDLLRKQGGRWVSVLHQETVAQH